LNWTWC